MNGSRRMSSGAYMGWMFMAAVADFFSILLPVGPVFIVFARATFWLNGYAGRGEIKTLVAFLAELFPGFSLAPSCLIFVYLFHKSNKKIMDAADREKAAQQAAAQKQTARRAT